MKKGLGYSEEEHSSPQAERSATNAVDDLIEFLHTFEKIYKLSQRNPWILVFLRELRQVLRDYPSQDAYNLITQLKERSARPKGRSKKHTLTKLAPEELASLTLADLSALLSDPNIDKEELLRIGQERLGLPKGSYRKVTKEELRARICAVIDNIETMDIISERAAH